MTNKEEFAVAQELKMIFAAQAPSTQLRSKFAQGSFFQKINIERNIHTVTDGQFDIQIDQPKGLEFTVHYEAQQSESISTHEE